MRSLKGELAFAAAVCAIALFLLFGVGCSGNTVYDSDRQLQEQNSEAAAIVAKSGDTVQQGLDTAQSALTGSTAQASIDALTKIAAAQAALQVQQKAAADIKANSDQELKNWGNPKASQPYTPTNSSNSRGQSDQQHQNPWYVQVGTIALSVLATAAGIFASANGIPAFGAVFNKPAMKALGAVFTTASNLQKKADADPNDMLHLSEIEAELADLAAKPEMQPYIDGLTKSLHLGQLLPETPPGSVPPPPPPPPGVIVTPAVVAVPAPAEVKA